MNKYISPEELSLRASHHYLGSKVVDGFSINCSNGSCSQCGGKITRCDIFCPECGKKISRPFTCEIVSAKDFGETLCKMHNLDAHNLSVEHIIERGANESFTVYLQCKNCKKTFAGGNFCNSCGTPFHKWSQTKIELTQGDAKRIAYNTYLRNAYLQTKNKHKED